MKINIFIVTGELNEKILICVLLFLFSIYHLHFFVILVSEKFLLRYFAVSTSEGINLIQYKYVFLITDATLLKYLK